MPLSCTQPFLDWSGGDTTYDGAVDFDDILALFPNYGGPSAFGSGLQGGSGGGSSLGIAGGGSGQATDQPNDGGHQRMGDPKMGPEAPPDLPERAVRTLSRGNEPASTELNATMLAFAGLADTRVTSEKI